MERKRGDTQQGEGETEVSLQWLEQKLHYVCFK